MKKSLRLISVVAASAMLLSSATIGYVYRSHIRAFLENKQQEQAQQDLPAEQDAQDFASSSEESTPSGIPANETPEIEIPAEINLNVPFTSQAPNANWELPYQEACEEASTIMVNAFYAHKQLSKSEADKQILALVDFQNKQYGFYKDTTAEEVARFTKAYWQYESVRILPASVDAIKQELAQGRPVLIPAAGRQLGNPNFTSPGPIYHMLVIKGYKKDGSFITNDPGTRRGENYVYKQSVLMNAIHDWNGGDVANGKKVMLVIDPKN